MILEGWDVLDRAVELRGRGEPFVLATVVWRRGPSSGKEGYRALITASGAVHGWIGGACAEPTVVREGRKALEEGVPKLLFLGTPDELENVGRDDVTTVPISCQSEGALEIYVEPVAPPPHLVVAGRSPMVTALTSMARAIGWEPVVVDPDDPHGRDHPDASRVVGQLDFARAGVSERSLVVVATQGHYDEDAVEQALATSPAYLGLVASHSRSESVRGYLRDRGFTEEQMAQVHGPAGLDLGRVSHREIAVAVLADLVQRKAAGELPLAAEASTAQAQVPEAADPVCGMTVDVESAKHTAEHEGVTYYFCCPGCRKAFRDDPKAFLGLESGLEDTRARG
jgi:xanthine dehydrogenase accessory factor